MKHYYALFLLFATTFTMSAQLTVNQWGQTRVGHDCDSAYIGHGLFENYRDTLSSLWVSGPDLNGNPARIILGDAQLGYYRNVDIGELYEYDPDEPINTNILHLHGAKGMRITKNNFANTIVAEYSQATGNKFNFNCDVKADAFIVNSDERYKKNVHPLNNPLGSLSQLTGVSYNLKSHDEINEMKGIRVTEKESNDPIFAEQHQRDNEMEVRYSKRFGLIAQEVQTVYPELVREDADGYLSVDYIGLIPLLINAVNELNEKVLDLEDENATLAAQLNVQAAPALAEVQEGSMVTTPRLYQNVPNPFTASTSIRCALPTTVTQAQVLVFDLQGKLLRTLDVTERGVTAVTLEASELPAGMYIYTLLADGEEVATKRMILTK